jgi:hypothetical protein
LILIIVFKQKDQIMNAIKSLGIALRFGGWKKENDLGFNK